jgi:beta-lactamase class A
VRYRGSFSFLRWGSLILVLFAIVLTTLQLVRFSRLRANFPSGLTIASIPVGTMNRQDAAERLLEAYSVPIELYYNDAAIQLMPATVGFELDTESMLAAADQERTRQPFWESFWDYLWGRPSQPLNIPLSATYSEQRLRSFLANEIAPRYDQPSEPAMPIIGTVDFQAGTKGTALDIDKSILPIENALFSPSQRTITLPLQEEDPSRPTFTNLEVLLKQTIDLSEFDGVIGVYLLDLKSGQEIYFISNQGIDLPYPPDVSFTASSTIKIPIMVSVYQRLGGDLNAETIQNLEDMIARSINTAADWLMSNKIDPIQGPLLVTEDMRILGLVNTFLAGYFFQGAPLLERFNTPGNQRSDVSTEPDPYNQTTPAEIGQLLQDIYQCAYSNNGTLIAAFPGEITQSECQSMINYLMMDKTARLIEAGLPDGTNIAHKHGWVTDAYGIIHDMSDAAIVFSPGGDFVMTVFMFDPEQIIFDPANELVKNLSRAVYNFYNLPNP